MKFASHIIYIMLIALVACLAYETGNKHGMAHINELIDCGWTVFDAEGFEIARYGITEE